MTPAVCARATRSSCVWLVKRTTGQLVAVVTAAAAATPSPSGRPTAKIATPLHARLRHRPGARQIGVGDHLARRTETVFARRRGLQRSEIRRQAVSLGKS